MIARLVHRSAAGVGIAAAAAATVVWLILASLTGLIFHLMPAGPPLVGAWAYRAAGGTGRLRDSAVLAAAGAGLSTLGAAVVAASGRPLDAWWFTGLTIAGGAAAAVWIASGRTRDRPFGG